VAAYYEGDVKPVSCLCSRIYKDFPISIKWVDFSSDLEDGNEFKFCKEWFSKNVQIDYIMYGSSILILIINSLCGFYL
jgi:hypothetical protein